MEDEQVEFPAIDRVLHLLRARLLGGASADTSTIEKSQDESVALHPTDSVYGSKGISCKESSNYDSVRHAASGSTLFSSADMDRLKQLAKVTWKSCLSTSTPQYSSYSNTKCDLGKSPSIPSRPSLLRQAFDAMVRIWKTRRRMRRVLLRLQECVLIQSDISVLGVQRFGKMRLAKLFDTLRIKRSVFRAWTRRAALWRCRTAMRCSACASCGRGLTVTLSQ